MAKTENEIIADRIRATAKALFDGVRAAFRFRVSLPGEPYPALDIPADSQEQAKERFNACCNIRWTPGAHKIEELPNEPKADKELQTVELLETPKHEPQRRRRNGSSPPGGG